MQVLEVSCYNRMPHKFLRMFVHSAFFGLRELQRLEGSLLDSSRVVLALKHIDHDSFECLSS